MVRMLAGCRSPCSHSAGPAHSGAAAASSQTARTASGSRISPSSVAEASPWVKCSAVSADAPPPAVSARGRPVGGGSVQSGQEGGQGDGRLRGARRGGTVGGLARYPGGDDPGPRKPFGGLTKALRDGDRQRKVRGRGRAARRVPCAAARPRTASPKATRRRDRRRAATLGCPSHALRASRGDPPGRSAARAAEPESIPLRCPPQWLSYGATVVGERPAWVSANPSRVPTSNLIRT